MPLPVGGVLIQSANSIIHVDQTSLPGIVCTVNGFYGRETRLVLRSRNTAAIEPWRAIDS